MGVHYDHVVRKQWSERANQNELDFDVDAQAGVCSEAMKMEAEDAFDKAKDQPQANAPPAQSHNNQAKQWGNHNNNNKVFVLWCLLFFSFCCMLFAPGCKALWWKLWWIPWRRQLWRRLWLWQTFVARSLCGRYRRHWVPA